MVNFHFPFPQAVNQKTFPNKWECSIYKVKLQLFLIWVSSRDVKRDSNPGRSQAQKEKALSQVISCLPNYYKIIGKPEKKVFKISLSFLSVLSYFSIEEFKIQTIF